MDNDKDDWFDLESLEANGIINLNNENNKYKADKNTHSILSFIIKKIKFKMSSLPKIITLYLSIAGFITFSLFILEESLQTAMFSTWAAKDAQDWALVMKANRFFEKTNKTMDLVNRYFGWINPFSYKAYNAYHDATRYVINANDAQIANFEPALLSNFDDNVFLHLKINQITNDHDNVILISGKFKIQYQNFMYMPSVGETIEFYGKIKAVHGSASVFNLEPLSLKKLNFNDN